MKPATSNRIIAELGINHDGSVEAAASLIKAVAPYVWGIKFQYRNIASVYRDGAAEIGDEILREEIEKNYLSPESISSLAELIHSHNCAAGISFFDSSDITDFGDDIQKFDFLKVPSAELTNAPLIDSMLDTGLPVYISTGCHSEREIDAAFSRIQSRLNWMPFHCISNYPALKQNARLGYIRHLKGRWSRGVGYSSHDDHWEICLLALQMGATIIERHVTFDKQADGIDHSTSSTPNEFETLKAFADELDLILAGNGPRVANQGELLNRQNLGRSFFARRDIAVGEKLNRDLLIYRSPKIGLGLDEIETILGQKTVKLIKKGDAVSIASIAEPQKLPHDIIEFARSCKIALPVRLHDAAHIQKEFPIRGFEFHLSFNEARSDLLAYRFDPNNRYSIHLPDYVDSTHLMDPFSPNSDQRNASLDIIDRVASFAQMLQDATGNRVPIVGSFSVVHRDLEGFFASHTQLLGGYAEDRGVIIMPQWLPPVAWYFGGSVRLKAMNNIVDARLIAKHHLPICMDISHLILGANFFGWRAEDLLSDLASHIGHIHIADAAGIDGEGVQIGEGDAGNMSVFSRSLEFDCLKVIEVWQGHLDGYAGFREALTALAQINVQHA